MRNELIAAAIATPFAVLALFASTLPRHDTMLLAVVNDELHAIDSNLTAEQCRLARPDLPFARCVDMNDPRDTILVGRDCGHYRVSMIMWEESDFPVMCDTIDAHYIPR